MKTLYLTDEAMRAIRSAASGNSFQLTGTRSPAGVWSVDVNDDVAARLDEIRFPLEGDSDVIIRMVALYLTGGRKQ